ncbi:MAG: putative beta-lysine N-acetyltransferase [Holophagae bacterium]
MTGSGSTTASEANMLARLDGDGFNAKVFFSPLNQRIQVLEYEARDTVMMVNGLGKGARDAGFGKVFLKAPIHQQAGFEDAGMEAEATITGYFAGQPAVVMSLFLDPDRRQQPCADEQADILDAIRSRPADPSVPDLPDGYRLLLAGPSDADELAELYREVFASYPFPITEPDYLVETMASHVLYRIVRDGSGAIVAAASAETDAAHRNAEMTDFATLPSERGLGLAQHILAALEDDMAERDIPYLYTVARARSAGMNRVFYNRGYRWTGTLVNNCHIAGRFEDMHVWCTSLDD